MTKKLWRCATFLAGLLASTVMQAAPPTGFQYCAAQNQTCRLQGTALVVFGVGERWTPPRPFKDRVRCSATAFGDPAPGQRKTCYRAPLPPAPVAVELTIEGNGRVLWPDGGACATLCSRSWPQGQPLSLRAEPASGARFVGWSLSSCGSASSCSFTPTAPTRLSARFEPAPTGGALITDRRLIGIPALGRYPAKGEAVVDPATGFTVQRVADKDELLGDYLGTRRQQSQIVYSRFTPTNVTGEFVLVHGDNSTSAWIYRVADQRAMTVLRFKPALGEGSRSLGELNELRWDTSGDHPYRLYFVGRSLPQSQAVGAERPGMSFYALDFNPATGTHGNPQLLRDFSADFPHTPGGELMNDVEGDASIGSRFWSWMVMDTTRGAGYLPYAVLSYDKQENRILGRLQRSCASSPAPCTALDTPATPLPYLSRPNFVEVSPLGTRVLLSWLRAYPGHADANIGGVADGPKAFKLDFSDPIRVGADSTHSGWAWGEQGEELYVSQNNRNDWIEAVDIRDAARANCRLIGSGGNSYACGTPLIRQPDLDAGSWSIGYHFGKIYDRNKRGWIYMNTYDNQASAAWGKNQHLLVRVRDGSSGQTPLVVRLGSTYNRYYDYRSEAAAALDWHGNALWSTANWGYTDGRGDVFQLRLPSHWWTLLPR